MKLKATVFAATFEFDTVAVAVYVPAARPVFGLTVNVPVALAARLVCDVFDSVNALEFAPLSAIVMLPVATLPVFVIVTVCVD